MGWTSGFLEIMETSRADALLFLIHDQHHDWASLF